MTEKHDNIFPIDHILGREDKEKLLNQTAKVIWLTGLSGSGKSTIAQQVEKELYDKGYLTKLLDGDDIRSGINSNLDFTEEDRKENVRRISEIAKLFLNGGVIVLSSFVSPTEEIRAMAKEIIGENDFIDVFVNCPLEVCEERDVKGLYKKARNGEIENFTGISAPFEEPSDPDIEVKTDKQSVEESVEEILKYILPLIKGK